MEGIYKNNIRTCSNDNNFLGLKKFKTMPGAVAQACNLSYLGSREWEASLGKKVTRSHLNQ
jgi:hypothetical protein